VFFSFVVFNLDVDAFFHWLCSILTLKVFFSLVVFNLEVESVFSLVVFNLEVESVFFIGCVQS
jgi:hypothetical protein